MAWCRSCARHGHWESQCAKRKRRTKDASSTDPPRDPDGHRETKKRRRGRVDGDAARDGTGQKPSMPPPIPVQRSSTIGEWTPTSKSRTEDVDHEPPVLEQAVSGRSQCQACKQKIPKYGWRWRHAKYDERFGMIAVFTHSGCHETE
jgi:hypothetical protein